MKKHKIVLFLLIFLLLPGYVYALGQMSEPIFVSNALRGETIHEEVLVVNSDKSPVTVKLGADGQIRDWVEYYLIENMENKITTTTIPAEGTLRLMAVLKVPNDILNGEYKGALSVTSVPNDLIKTEESGASVMQKIDRQVTIIVSDTELIDIKNSSIIPSDYDLSVNEPLNIRIIYDNQGNVSLAPQIRLKIKKDKMSVEDGEGSLGLEKNIYDMIYPYPEDVKSVNPGSQFEINPILIQTTGWGAGKYLAQLEFYHNNEVLLEKNFSFSISDKKIITIGIINKIDLLSYLWIIMFAVALIAMVVWQMKKRKKTNIIL